MANPTTAILAKMAAQCLQLAADLEAQESNPAPSGDANAPKTLDEIRKFYPAVTDGWLRGHVAPVGKGPRQRRMYCLSDVRAALESHPGRIRKTPTKTRAPQGDEDELDALLASGAVRR